jgi:hypothetical protein
MTILGLLSNYYNPDLFWHNGNLEFLNGSTKKNIDKLLTKCFGAKEMELILPYMRDGVIRGRLSYYFFLILNAIEHSYQFLKEISFRADVNSDDRNFYFWLYLYVSKNHSVDETLKTAEIYLTQFPEGREEDALTAVLESLRNGEVIHIG